MFQPYCDWLIFAQGYDFSDHLAQQDSAAGFTVILYEYEIYEMGEIPATKSFETHTRLNFKVYLSLK